MPRQRHVILPDDLDAALQAYADARGLSLAAAVRVILHEKLTADPMLAAALRALR